MPEGKADILRGTLASIILKTLESMGATRPRLGLCRRVDRFVDPLLTPGWDRPNAHLVSA
jgi:hypothetical protein